VLYMQHGSAPPAGYAFVGTFRQRLEVTAARSPVSLRIDVWVRTRSPIAPAAPGPAGSHRGY
jgi:hypothetical protein